jgi:hypothetical protein
LAYVGTRPKHIIDKRILDATLPEPATLIALYKIDLNAALKLVVYCAMGYIARLLHALAIALASGGSLQDFDKPLADLGQWYLACRPASPPEVDLLVGFPLSFRPD